MSDGPPPLPVAPPALSWFPAELTLGQLGVAALVVALAIFGLAAMTRLVLQALLPWLGLGERVLRCGQASLLQRWPAHRLPWLRSGLGRPPAELAVLAVAGTLLWLAAAALLELTEAVVEEETLLAIDRAVFQQLQHLRTPEVDLAMIAITDLGGAWVTGPLTLAVALWMAWRRQWAAFGYWVGGAIATRLSVVLLKSLLGRARPTEVYSGVETLSFPSGHATTAMVLYGFLAFLLGRELRPASRHLLYAGAGVLIAAIGLSRLYLGVHWLSDVGAGYALGVGWVTLLAVAFARLHRRERLPTRQLAAVVGLTLVVAVAAQFSWRLDASLERYRPDAVPVLAPAAGIEGAGDAAEPR